MNKALTPYSPPNARTFQTVQNKAALSHAEWKLLPSQAPQANVLPEQTSFT